MKTIFTLLVGSLLSIAALANDFRSSQLTVTVQDRNYKVVVDGKKFELYGSSVIINNIDPGYHTVSISKLKVNPLFGILGIRTEVLYNSTIQVKPNTAITLTVDKFGKAFIDEQRMRGNGRGRDDDDYYDNGRGNGRDKDWKDKDDRNNGYGQYNAYVNVMSNVEFQRVLDCIDKEWFEINKMKSASQIISTNYFTSSQVKQMLQLFSFESNKLELAKQAYSKTVDKQNYQCVSEVLMFRSSKDELARFISTCR